MSQRQSSFDGYYNQTLEKALAMYLPDHADATDDMILVHLRGLKPPLSYGAGYFTSYMNARRAGTLLHEPGDTLWQIENNIGAGIPGRRHTRHKRTKHRFD